MDRLEAIAEQIHQEFEEQTTAREQALRQCRTLTRRCAHAIRAVHREEWDLAQHHLREAAAIVQSLREGLAKYPALFYAGYTQDALKEFAEASIVFALVGHHPLPTPQDLGIEAAVYIQGLAEAAGELRRRCLDILRNGYSSEAERLLDYMDDIYAVLVTMDYPDAVTGGLRRLTDIVRGVTERTRGDLTLTYRQEQLGKAISRLENGIRDPDG